MNSGRYLLDTHTLLWAFYGPEHLSRVAASAILAADELFVSMVSQWEISLKFSRGGFGDLPVPADWDDSLIRELTVQDYRFLAIETRHCRLVQDIPFHHKDLFDRMLVAQALSEGLTLISRDGELDAYGVKRVW